MQQATQHLVTWMALFVVALAITIFPSTVQAQSANQFPCGITNQFVDNWFYQYKTSAGNNATDYSLSNMKMILYKGVDDSNYQLHWYNPSSSYVTVLLGSTNTNSGLTTQLRLNGSYRTQSLNANGTPNGAPYSSSLSHTTTANIQYICGIYNAEVVKKDGATYDSVQEYFPYSGDIQYPVGIKLAQYDDTAPFEPALSDSTYSRFSLAYPELTSPEPSTGGSGLSDENIIMLGSLAVAGAIAWVLVAQFRWRR